MVTPEMGLYIESLPASIRAKVLPFIAAHETLEVSSKATVQRIWALCSLSGTLYFEFTRLVD